MPLTELDIDDVAKATITFTPPAGVTIAVGDVTATTRDPAGTEAAATVEAGGTANEFIVRTRATLAGTWTVRAEHATTVGAYTYRGAVEESFYVRRSAFVSP